MAAKIPAEETRRNEAIRHLFVKQYGKAEIARWFGMSRERVRQIVTRKKSAKHS